MAVVLVLAAGVTGFLAAVVGWTVFGLGVLAGLGLWSLSGMLGFALALVLAQLPGRGTPPAPQHPCPA